MRANPDASCNSRAICDYANDGKSQQFTKYMIPFQKNNASKDYNKDWELRNNVTLSIADIYNDKIYRYLHVNKKTLVKSSNISICQPFQEYQESKNADIPRKLQQNIKEQNLIVNQNHSQTIFK